MKKLDFRSFTEKEHQTWKFILEHHTPKRDRQIHKIFLDGLEKLDMPLNRIPKLSDINQKLEKLTGFQGLPVEGLEDGNKFFYHLSQRKFPIGNFIRDPNDLAYTPAPDVIHDLYGHIPFFTNEAYADFCYNFGVVASKYVDQPKLLRQFERLFWFTIEFALVKTSEGPRIFGAGIASSYGECEYALSKEPEILPFDIEVIRNNEYRIDEFQKRLYILENPEQLYACLDEFEAGLHSS